MARTRLRGRPTDKPLAGFFFLFVPWFALFLPLTRAIHTAGHLIGAWMSGTTVIGFYAPFFGADLGLVNYPSASWSATNASLPFLLGGAVSAIALGLLCSYFWPPSYGAPQRLLPLQFGIVLLVHGVVEPWGDLTSRSEAALAAELFGIPAVWLFSAGGFVALAVAVHLSLRAARLASVVANLGSGSRRLVFIAAFWTLPELGYRAAQSIVGGGRTIDLVSGAALAIGPMLAVAALPPGIFHQKIEAEGLLAGSIAGWLAAPAVVFVWVWVSAGWAPPRAHGILWGTPSPFNNIRPETPVRSPRAVFRGEKSEAFVVPELGIHPTRKRTGK